jgi:hypothetical protein
VLPLMPELATAFEQNAKCNPELPLFRTVRIVAIYGARNGWSERLALRNCRLYLRERMEPDQPHRVHTDHDRQRTVGAAWGR